MGAASYYMFASWKEALVSHAKGKSEDHTFKRHSFRWLASMSRALAGSNTQLPSTKITIFT